VWDQRTVIVVGDQRLGRGCEARAAKNRGVGGRGPSEYIGQRERGGEVNAVLRVGLKVAILCGDTNSVNRLVFDYDSRDYRVIK